jgi:hypothetical protein
VVLDDIALSTITLGDESARVVRKKSSWRAPEGRRSVPSARLTLARRILRPRMAAGAVEYWAAARPAGLDAAASALATRGTDTWCADDRSTSDGL